MIREHFNLIAKALHKTKPREIPDFTRDQYLDFEAQWEEDVDALAEVLQQTNKRFDKDRFIKACKEGEQ